MKFSRIASILMLSMFGFVLSLNVAGAAENKTKTVEIKTSIPTTQVQTEIENSLYELNGVKNVTFEKKNTVKVEYDSSKLSGDEIVYYMSEKGYTAQIVSTDDKKADTSISNK